MYIIFDVGGTKTRIACTRDLTEFSEPVVFNTPNDVHEFAREFNATIQMCAGNEPIEAMAGDIAGPFQRGGNVLLSMPSIPTWGTNIPIRDLMCETCGVPVTVYNDACVVGLGESVFGAARGYSIVAYLTVSTGVGGARITNGAIDTYLYSFEPGWQIIDAGGAECDGCSAYGYLIDYISGSGIERRTGQKPEEIHDADFWRKQARFLAYGISNTAVYWSPDVVVLGGSVMKSIDIEAVKENLKDMLTIYPDTPDICMAELGDYGGLYGGMALLSE